jgi:two-component system KDP operon response regulator KdpE
VIGVLVVDADDRCRSLVAAALRDAGYRVEAADDPAHAAAVIRRRPLDAILLDPGDEPQAAVAAIRRQTDVPMILISALDDHERRVAALDAGADDFVAKPFVIEELLARVRVWLRRAARPHHTPPVVTADFVIQLDERRLLRADGSEVTLTPTEWRLVEILARRPGQLVGHDELLQAVWGPKGEGKTDYLRVYMAGIRRKVEPEPSRPRYFLTVPGVGHRFVADSGVVTPTHVQTMATS